MSKIVGYTQYKKKLPGWFWLALLFFALLLFVLWLVSLNPTAETEKKTTTTTHKKAATTTTTKQQLKPTTSTVVVKSVPKLEQPTVDNNMIKVLKQDFCKMLEDQQPREIAKTFAPEERVYCYTEIEATSPPVVITQVWFDGAGNRYFAIDLDIWRQPGRTWSMITLPPDSDGTWQVKVMAGEKILSQQEFKVVARPNSVSE
ncbi:hypothetical protein COT42_03470 [Candidatus Saganbacteria bacterium CG08_land_8_20_14_0_20_45_16]|uniref:DUF2914 domain-containing protein n=1 Tax=Candidatus Saganbacteria bacterium CG08_land_8_20_14_0_20_45_16 TaxID=2014293 RepID=A0A2H0XYZ4_UNCSA|nr:MAG: hypothetical protein COT42_03470 [Candidatus Saganbacteria bacterium CG08_land_8_20_14_0_20_45_16]